MNDLSTSELEKSVATETNFDVSCQTPPRNQEMSEAIKSWLLKETAAYAERVMEDGMLEEDNEALNSCGCIQITKVSHEKVEMGKDSWRIAGRGSSFLTLVAIASYAGFQLLLESELDLEL